MAEDPVDYARILQLLRTRGLSIRSLDEPTRRALRSYLVRTHFEEGLSLSDLAKRIGNKTSGYTSWLCKELGDKARPFEEARLKGIREKRRKYERRPFDGTDEDKAYLLGLRHGDLSVSRPWKGVVRVSNSTTHPAMVELFRGLFEKCGHVYQFPRYKKEVDAYEWNVQVNLDDSFSLLLMSFEEARPWFEEKKERAIAYFSGFLDAEGSVLVTKNTRGKAVVFVDYFNQNRTLLEWIALQAKRMGIGGSLRINKPVGQGKTGYHLFNNKDYWQLSLFGAHMILNFLRELKLRHREKLSKRAVALSLLPGERYAEIDSKVVQIRMGIKREVKEFVDEAKSQYLSKHPQFFPPVRSGQVPTAG